ncbi:MAG TPA: hypothetical protein VJ276_20855 [Thermoanaerobaculia bacterium]|nr:hypothetical protein [Thermoanaerobaculia bacterium]
MTPNNRLLLAAALASAALLSAPHAKASLARAVDFDTKVADAESIVLGKVVRTESRWDAGHRWILTYSTFRVEKALKGVAGSEVTLVTPGGQVGNVGQSTVGIPEFREGDENVVFVKQSQAGPTVLYFDQGTYEVTRDGNQRMVTPVSTDAVVVDTQRGMAVTPEQPRTLAQFEAEVKRAEHGALQRMELIRQRERQQAEANSLSSIILRNKLLIALALVGMAVATWQIVKK